LALDADEEPAVDVVEKLRADYLVVSTDCAHPDGAFPEAMSEFLALPLDDAARRKILWDARWGGNAGRTEHTTVELKECDD